MGRTNLILCFEFSFFFFLVVREFQLGACAYWAGVLLLEPFCQPFVLWLFLR
jgi:hypothetical protein